MHMSSCVNACLQRPEVHVKYLPQLLSKFIFVFEMQSFTEPRTFHLAGLAGQ